MQTIALIAINARYSHSSLGMRYLRANLGPLRDSSVILEFNLKDTPACIAEEILKRQPGLIAVGVYIWNRPHVEELIKIIKSTAPEIPILLGGPEISYDTNSPLAAQATCVVCGEADLSFRDICERLLAGQTMPPLIPSSLPDLTEVILPYNEYSDKDLATRTIYSETSRGCVYGCEYCISSINPGIRHFDLDRLLPEFDHLIERGALRFKFVDRSFNLAPDHACAVLDFFIARWKPGMCLHLEMTPDQLPSALRKRILSFPPGGLHIEVGIQTFNEAVAIRVGRKTDLEAAVEGIRFLIDDARADVHADLIAGLPGETPESFEAGIDRLIALHPTELQIGILKRLHGAPIIRHEKQWNMKFRATPPYDILSTSTMDEAFMRKIRRFSMHWDRIVNRQWFPSTTPLLLDSQSSAFTTFDKLSLQIDKSMGMSGFGMTEAARVVFEYLTKDLALPIAEVKTKMRNDYQAGGRRINVPNFLR